MRVRQIVQSCGVFVLATVLVGSMFSPAAVVQALGGAGTSGSPYQITSCADFIDIEDDYDAYYILMNDIDCSASGDAITIGDNILAFMGHFDGNNKNITIDINNTSYPHDVAGLFNYVASATISDLTINGSITTEVSTGALAGFVEYSTISNITVNATVVGGDHTGGLVGHTSSTDVIGANVSGDVSGAEGVGGLMGFADGTSISDSHYNGDATASSNFAGGLVGDSDLLPVTRSSTTGSVTGGDCVGGLVGRLAGTAAITQSFSTSDITANQFAGGLVGQMMGTTSVQNSYARGDVTATNYGAGIAGAAATSSLSNVYATGHIVSAVGASGLLAVDTGGSTLTDSFWNVYGGTNPLTTAGTFTVGLVGNQGTNTMTLYPLYSTHFALSAPWDFDTIWGMNETDNNSYPFLLWQGWISDPPRDNDGIPSSVEDVAPNGGDANNDGTPDAEQDYVASLVSTVSDTYATAVVSTDCVLGPVASTNETAHAMPDASFAYPAGFINFAADCAVTPFVADIQVYFYGLSTDAPVVRKYKPTTGAYFTVPGATFAKQTIGGVEVYIASYQVADGGPLDTDDIANGIITDPIGLGVSTVSVPNTGLGGLARF